ncbi:MAG TPA: YaiI/YqxD family protein [Psychromonas hadalis]|nr:YaiI/YqxD family protein [Psychromonas hadalis]
MIEKTCTIWIDADACPVAVREIVLKASLRTNTPLIFVANSPVPVLRRDLVKMVQVAQGFDVADNYISQHVQTIDLVITQDIPLAAELVEKGVTALNPRGELYTIENIRQRLAMRNFSQALRDCGQMTKGQNKFGDKEKQGFANALDRWLQKNSK